MSRKHYTEVAAILHAGELSTETVCVSIAQLQATATDMALMFKRDNPRFNAGKFFDAAGFPELTASRMGLN